MSLQTMVVQHSYRFSAPPPASMLLIGVIQQKNVLHVLYLHCKGLLCTQAIKGCDSSFCITQQQNPACIT